MARRKEIDEIEIRETAEPGAYSADAGPGARGLRSSAAIAATALKAGQFAPDFTLPDLRGGNLSLSHLLASGPVVLTFHRGDWCPHSAASLRTLTIVQRDVARLGAVIVAISPQEPASALAGPAPPFAIARDRGAKVARAYGLTFVTPTPSGRHDELLPIPATYVVDRGGRIVLSFIDADYRNRVEPNQLLAALTGLRHR
jgi:peroxiredoxin